MPRQHTTNKTLIRLKDGSLRVLKESEHAVERQFQEVRLFGSVAVALLLVGFLLVAQWRGNAVASSVLEGRSDADLAQVVQELALGNEDLRSEALELQTRIARSQQDVESQRVLVQKARSALSGMRLTAGLEPAQGTGVRIEIKDPQHVLLAQDIVSLMQELRSAGAEAISISGVRVGALTGFTDGVLGVRTAGTVLGHTLVVYAIGDPDQLEQALALLGGIHSTLTAYPGVTMDTVRQDKIQVPAIDE